MLPQTPYNPESNIFNKLFVKFRTFFSLRNVENEFVDFKTYYFMGQMENIYSDLHTAYNRKDKVILERSLSEDLKKYWGYRLKNELPNPLFEHVGNLSIV